MTKQEAMQTRHSVRKYTDQAITGEVKDALLKEIADCNQASGLHIQACFDEANAFSGKMASYGSFHNVRNYICLVGKKADKLDEKIGYYGERIVLTAQQLGLRTCWVAMTYSKSKIGITVANDEKVYCVLSIGYGVTDGVPHKNKDQIGRAHV